MHSIDVNNIKPLTDFRNHTKKYIQELKNTKNPIILTQYGKSAAVLLDPEHFQELQDQIEFMRKVTLGLDDVKNKQIHSFSDTLNDVNAIITEVKQK